MVSRTGLATAFVRSAGRLLVCLGLLTAAPFGQATAIRPTSLAELIDKADVVFTGIVQNDRCEWGAGPGGRAIFTVVKFIVLDTYKGERQSAVELRFLGGSVGNTRMEVDGMPIFFPGEQVLLFVRLTPGASCPAVGYHHGKLTVERDPKSGSTMVKRHNGEAVFDFAQIGSDAADLPSHSQPGTAKIKRQGNPLSLQDLQIAIRNHLGGPPNLSPLKRSSGGTHP